MTEATPKGHRLHIALFGRTNVGKSSLLNLLTGQSTAITSPLAGTTTDVVEKAVELLPLGPVLFLDTAGLDDTSALADRRLEKTRRIFDRADAALLVTEADRWTPYEENVAATCAAKAVPLLVILNKADVASPPPAFLRQLTERRLPFLSTAATDTASRDITLTALKQALAALLPESVLSTPSLLDGILPPRGVAVFVVPIDLEAPKGRLILPQVQALRDALDLDAAAFVTKENGLADTLARLVHPPDLVVCDSQAVRQVVAATPSDIACTTFSILLVRQKGNLNAAAEGAAAISRLQSGDAVLIAEACTHHAVQDDIGRVKIPRWLRQFVGPDLQIDVVSGRDYPADLACYRLIIHCGACMLNRREMLSRMRQAKAAGVPITNYGIAISYLQGVLPRTLAPFPEALLAFQRLASHKDIPS